jgi:uncharacterized small protein (DUF1192 family)
MEDDLPRKRGPGDELGAASRLAGEALDSYSQDELLERIRLLEAEIERVRAHHSRAAEQRRLADALFRARDPG